MLNRPEIDDAEALTLLRKTFAARLKSRLDAVGLSQAKLSERIGVRRQNVSSWVHGEALPNGVAIRRISEVLQTSISYLYGEVDDPRSARSWATGSNGEQFQTLAEIHAQLEGVLGRVKLLSEQSRPPGERAVPIRRGRYLESSFARK